RRSAMAGGLRCWLRLCV
ncbi:DNA topoisomerase IV, A subunit, partial [Vibrio parahaemolyticus VPTS-2010]